VKEIKKRANLGFTQTVQEELEQLDTSLNEILLEAERSIETEKQDPWSPALDNAYRIWQYWQTTVSHKKNKRNLSSRTIQWMKKSTQNLDVFQGNTRASVSHQLRTARKKLNIFRKLGKSLQKTHMEELAYKYSLKDTVDQAKVVKRMG
jgi:hypothetical protein